MRSPGQFLGGAIGSAVARAAEAVRRGVTWVVDRGTIHKAQPQLDERQADHRQRSRQRRSEPIGHHWIDGGCNLADAGTVRKRKYPSREAGALRLEVHRRTEIELRTRTCPGILGFCVLITRQTR